jgi:hypothetical protein
LHVSGFPIKVLDLGVYGEFLLLLLQIMMLFVVTRALACFEFVIDFILHECEEIYLVSFDFLAIKLFMFCTCDLLLINT